MDFSKLDSNEKLAVYGAGAAILGAIIAQIGSFYGAGGLWLSLLLAIAMLAIVFMPQWSPTTNLPGSKGSLMLIVGGIAGIGALLGLLAILPALGAFGLYGGLWFIGILIGIIGGLLMGWAGWQAFQAEGGKFQVGTAPASSGSTAGASTPAAPPPAPPATPAAPPPAAPPAEPMRSEEPMRTDEPMGGMGGSEDDRT
ncbi:MAG TPA: hypothetical protein VHU77_10265 [Candidatus Limnocylindria bacterium]|jgi:hypothetical protein|nr:hypothetical protein [Candidatus Limnocylindria bacterium]